MSPKAGRVELFDYGHTCPLCSKVLRIIIASFDTCGYSCGPAVTKSSHTWRCTILPGGEFCRRVTYAWFDTFYIAKPKVLCAEAKSLP